MRHMICVLAVAGLLAGGGCGSAGRNTEKPSKAATTSMVETTRSGAGADVPVRVYFVRADKVATAGRNVARNRRFEQAMQALLAGPDDFERGIGMTTEIPAGTNLLGLDVVDTAATVNLSHGFQSDGAGPASSLAMRQRIAEVVFTLTQFEHVERVTITAEGRPIAGAADLTRSDLEAVTPQILVESPVPGQSVVSPLRVSGIAHVFEGTVSYSVKDSAGLVLRDGFTTASTGSGDFSFTATYGTQRTGLGSVIVWQTSMEDGSHLNVYEVPVILG